MPETIMISGASGFIAGHAVEQLLAAGHPVIGTVRNPDDTEKTAHLRAMPGADERLRLVAANLTDADPFSAYTPDADVVLHTASPFTMSVKDAQRDLVDPAVEGTLSMLRAAAASPRVRRVVLTSSMAAITDEPEDRVLSEADWNEKSSLTRNPYYYSKTLAERAAWEFMEQEKPHFDLVVINPFLVIGPAHTAAVSTSNQIFIDLAKGQYPVIMDLTWGIVDVRDVARAHVLAIDPAVPAGRYICSAGYLSMAEMVAIARQQGYGNAKLPKRTMTGGMGTALMRLAAYTQPKGVRSYLHTHLGRVPRVDNRKIVDTMGMSFRSPEDSLRDTLADLTRWGHIPAPEGQRQAA